MARVESKTHTEIEIEVIGYNGRKKGHLNLTTGNMNFYRPNARKPTATYSYQQLIELIERDISAKAPEA